MFFLFHLLRGAIHQLQQWAQHRATVLDIFLHAPRASSCQGLEELGCLNHRLRAEKPNNAKCKTEKQCETLCETLRKCKMGTLSLSSLKCSKRLEALRSGRPFLSIWMLQVETTRRLRTQAPCTLQQQPQQRRGAAFEKVWSSLAHCELDWFLPFFTNIIQSSKYVNTCQCVYCTVYLSSSVKLCEVGKPLVTTGRAALICLTPRHHRRRCVVQHDLQGAHLPKAVRCSENPCLQLINLVPEVFLTGSSEGRLKFNLWTFNFRKFPYKSCKFGLESEAQVCSIDSFETQNSLTWFLETRSVSKQLSSHTWKSPRRCNFGAFAVVEQAQSTKQP